MIGLDSRLDPLGALHAVSAHLGQPQTLDELLPVVMDAVIQLSRAERGCVMLLGADGELALASARDFESLSIHPDDVTISRTVVQQAIASREAILTDNAQMDTRFSDTVSIMSFSLRSIMCVPLLAHGEILGAMYVDNRFISGLFTEQDLVLLETFANQVALAIDSARLREGIRTAVPLPESWSPEIDKEIRRSIASLRRALAQLQLESTADPLSVQHQAHATADRQAVHLGGLLANLADIKQLIHQHLPLKLEPVSLPELVAETLTVWRPQIARRSQDLLVELPPDLPVIFADRQRVKQMLHHLLSNATRFTPNGGRILVCASPRADSLWLEIVDTGFGIPAAEQRQVFHLFFRSQHPELRKRSGWGLGLPLVKLLSAAHAGQLLLESTPGKGSKFTLVLPLRSV